MKNFLIIVFCFFLTSCKLYEKNKLVFDIGKEITRQSLEEIYSAKLNFDKDSLYLSATIAKAKTRKILGEQVSKAFTMQGKILVENLNFFAVLEYSTPHPDSTTIITQYYKKQ